MKIKEIKIVNQDQSTEVASIGADAINVDYNDTTVKAELDKLNNNVDTNTTNISNEMVTRANAVTNLQSQINGLASGSPLVASSISEMTDTTKVYVNTSDGKWYYYNGDSWEIGGTYQSTAIEQDKISQNINISKVYSYQSPEAVAGYYDYYNGDMRLNESVSHKCIHIKLNDNNCFLSYTVLSTISSAIAFVKLNNNSIINLGAQNLNNYPLLNATDLYVNFFNNNTYINNFILTYSDLIRKNNICDLNISKNNINNEFIINKSNCSLTAGYYQSNLTINKSTTSHFCAEIEIKNDRCKLSFSGNNLSNSLSFGYMLKKDNSIVSIGSSVVTNLSLRDIKKLYLNFFNGFADEFKIMYDNDNINKYDDYIYNNYNFSGKTLCFAGDSITRGYTSGTTQTNNNYPKLFADYVNATPLNIAIGGALYTAGYNEAPTLLQQITSNSNKSVSYLFLAGGVNDCQMGVPLSDFKTAVQNTLNYALENYTGDIIIITPINNFKNFPNAVEELDYYSNIITEVAITLNNNRISIVQGHKFNFPNNSSNSSYISAMYGDGLHPTELGYRTAYLRGLIKALLK